MNVRPSDYRALLLVLLVSCLALGPAWGQDKDKDSIKALFDGIPADLRAKVRDNPVRCDRVNDWLKENVNGKGKTVEVKLGVNNISTSRSKDGTYLVRLSLASAKANVLEDKWGVSFNNQVPADVSDLRTEFEGRYNFAFEGLSTPEAEKLADMKQLVVEGKVLEAKLARTGPSPAFARGGIDESSRELVGTIGIALEDVRVDGKKWTPYISPVAARKTKGGFPLQQPKKTKGQSGATEPRP